MTLGKVVGNVVSTVKHPDCEGYKLLLIQPDNGEINTKVNQICRLLLIIALRTVRKNGQQLL